MKGSLMTRDVFTKTFEDVEPVRRALTSTRTRTEIL
jgi:hypothetical protein